jgi:hypothetical protein
VSAARAAGILTPGGLARVEAHAAHHSERRARSAAVRHTLEGRRALLEKEPGR